MSQPLAYLYSRFSDIRQDEGDSIRRQVDAARRWCEQNRYTLVEERYRDEGVSAHKGKHRTQGALSEFLRDVESGEVPEGAVILVENIDRLSREKPVEFLDLLVKLLKGGIRIVQTTDGAAIDNKSGMWPVMQILMSQSRGHEESQVKGKRVRDNWDNWRKTGKSRGGAIRPGPVPFWLDRDEDGYALNPEKAKVVRLVFQWAGDGWGAQRIQAELRRRELTLTQPRAYKRLERASDGYVSIPYLNKILQDKTS